MTGVHHSFSCFLGVGGQNWEVRFVLHAGCCKLMVVEAVAGAVGGLPGSPFRPGTAPPQPIPTCCCPLLSVPFSKGLPLADGTALPSTSPWHWLRGPDHPALGPWLGHSVWCSSHYGFRQRLGFSRNHISVQHLPASPASIKFLLGAPSEYMTNTRTQDSSSPLL